MTANTKTTWSVWGILFGMAIVLGIGVAFLAFTLTRDPQILAFLYEKSQFRRACTSLPILNGFLTCWLSA